MIAEKYNEDWRFWKLSDSFAILPTIPTHADIVCLPHDAMIQHPAGQHSMNGGNTGYRDGDIYVYAKRFYVSEEDVDQSLLLKFEGVYMNAFVYINGEFAAKNPFGYSTFYVSMDPFLRYGEENEIWVQVRAGAMTNSRWYSGAGIYRDVYLYKAGLTYIVQDGIRITTEDADEECAVLRIETEVKNRCHGTKNLRLETTLTDEKGNRAAQEETAVILFEQETRKISARITVENPDLWSDKTPCLYTYESRLIDSDSGRILDTSIGKFGIRTLQLDAKRGLRINGKCVKLRGACIHHDSGLLGAATYEEAQFRQIWKLKQAGFNAVRMSHHPMAPAMLRACDSIGIYVMDETFDMWNQCKTDYDYALYFREWWEKDVEMMVQKDYNHPSVILYSIGNEIAEIGNPHGAKMCHDICRKIKSLDTTRYTLASINGIFASGSGFARIFRDVSCKNGGTGDVGNVNELMTMQEEHQDEIVVHDVISKCLEIACAYTDIAGYNYMTARYEKDARTYPQRILVGSETYPQEIGRNWGLVQKYPNIIGDFTWTGWDYIGEAGIGIPGYQQGEGGFGAVYPAQLAYCGDLDITGYRRPMSYYREIVFGDRKEPYIAVQNPYGYGKELFKTPWVMSDSISSWNWHGYEGKPVVVEVYSAGDEVELFWNDVSLGRKKKDRCEYRTLFDTVYKPGILKAAVYEDGQMTGETILKTAGEEQKLVLTEETCCKALNQNQSLKYFKIEICDQEGILITDRDQKLTLEIEGNADLAGFGSGNPKPRYDFKEKTTETFQGRAQIILKNVDDRIRIRVTSENGIIAEWGDQGDEEREK